MDKKNKLGKAKVELDIEEMQQDSLRKRKSEEEHNETEEASKESLEALKI